MKPIQKSTEQMIQAALSYLKQGYSVIPVSTDKQPLVKWTEFQKRFASEDEVNEWFSRFPSANIAIVTGAISNLAVIDVENGGDVSIFPETAKVQTGGGGYHLYYQHPKTTVRNGVRIAELTDIRGDGGIVVAPPSIGTKGPYIWIDERAHDELTVFPVALIESLQAVKVAELVLEISDQIPTGKRNDAAVSFLGRLLTALPEDLWETAGWDAVTAWNINKLAEPLSPVELKKIFTSVKQMAASSKEEKKNTFVLKPFTLAELYEEELPEIGWVAQDLIPFSGVTAITGESNVYKSFLTLALAKSVLEGTPFLGHFPTTQGPVLIIDAENHRQSVRRRMEALGTPKNDKIHFISQSDFLLDNPHHVAVLKQLVDQIQPRLIIFDSLVRLHSRDENSASEMKQVMKALTQFVAMDRAVIFIHHHKKEQGFSQKGTTGKVRGSGDIFNALDCHLAIEKKGDNRLRVVMNKLRIQQQLAPFNVVIDLVSKNLQFIYEGKDTSREDELAEVKETTYQIIFSAAEPITLKTIQEFTKCKEKLIREALAELKKENKVTYTVGAKGTHHFMIPITPDDRVLSLEDIPF